jgi:hypothetical protein
MGSNSPIGPHRALLDDLRELPFLASIRVLVFSAKSVDVGRGGEPTQNPATKRTSSHGTCVCVGVGGGGTQYDLQIAVGRLDLGDNVARRLWRDVENSSSCPSEASACTSVGEDGGAGGW